MFFISRSLYFKSFKDGGIVFSPVIGECTLNDLIRNWGRVVQRRHHALNLIILGLGATIIYIFYKIKVNFHRNLINGRVFYFLTII